jgi:hypothetical protein
VNPPIGRVTNQARHNLALIPQSNTLMTICRIESVDCNDRFSGNLSPARRKGNQG